MDEPEITTDETSEEGNDIQDFNIELDDDGQITLSLE
jgi:topoisomerase-4 subunit A